MLLRYCLAGSLLFHIIMIGVIGFCLPYSPSHSEDPIFEVIAQPAFSNQEITRSQPSGSGAGLILSNPFPLKSIASNPAENDRRMGFSGNNSTRLGGEHPLKLASEGPPPAEGEKASKGPSLSPEPFSGVLGSDSGKPAGPGGGTSGLSDEGKCSDSGTPGLSDGGNGSGNGASGLSGGGNGSGLPYGKASVLPEPDVPPVKIFSPSPEYPWKAKVNNWQGTTVLKVEILTSGKIGKAEIITSSGYVILDKAALKSIKTWRYKPALKNGVAVVCFKIIPVRFHLEG